MDLLIGPRTYSTWSLRGWLVVKRTGAPFTTRHARYETEADRATLAGVSPSRFVPLLTVEGEQVWDTLAIAEWAAETFPDARMWPADPIARAKARSVSAEMHSGFSALRTVCGTSWDHPMVGTSRADPPSDPGLSADLRRLVEIFTGMRARFGADGPFLFGAWSIADAFFTPVAARVRHFQLDLAAHGDVEGVARAYVETLLAQPDFLEWERLAASEMG